MSHFTVFLPGPAAPAGPPPAFDRLARLLEESFGAAVDRRPSWAGAHGIVGTGPDGAELHTTERGFVVVAGRILDLRSVDGRLDARALLERLAHDDPAGLDRYEGVFALVAWDGPTRAGWVVNDQASSLHCYWGEHGGGLYATTAALPLARALGLGLDPEGIAELFARGMLVAPSTPFAGLHRLGLGEHVRVRDGRCTLGRHWIPFREPRRELRRFAAVERIAELTTDRIRRYARGAPVVADLTGGYDSRLVVSAAVAAGRLDAVTVNGPPEHPDVVVARQVAGRLGRPLLHFDPATFWDRPITPELRSRLTSRTGGELAFTEVYHHLLSRPVLARDYGLHLTGGGGELLRSFPWAQEFLGIGRRRPADVENLLAYRFFQEGAPPAGLFRDAWHPLLVESFRVRARAIAAAGPGTLTTQQLDALYLWRMTGFSSYTSAVFPWLPTVPPLMCAETVETMIALPWPMRLTSGLVRALTRRLCPTAAAQPTRYGGIAAPVSLRSAPRELLQLARSAGHLATKLDRVRFGGRFSRRFVGPGVAAPRKPYLGPELRAFLDPARATSRTLYEPGALAALLDGADGAPPRREALLLRIATVEELCRQLDFRPEPGFLLSRPGRPVASAPR